MTKLSAREARAGLTLIEVLVVIAICAIAIAVILPAMVSTKPDRANPCLFRLKQVDLAVLMYAGDNNGETPMWWPVSNRRVNGNSVHVEYQKLAAYLHRPDVLICPVEKHRHAATNFNQLTDTNLSYFLNADASITNSPTVSIVAGDRNLQADGHPVSPGLFVLTTNLDMNWTRELHSLGGYLAFADGHVQFCPTDNLNALVQRQSIGTNRLFVP